jgi:Photoprotection regulator fluorescence recovery protein
MENAKSELGRNTIEPTTTEKTRRPFKSSELQFPAEDTNMTSPAVNQYPSPMAHLIWSQTEKAIARKVFESALRQELEAVIRETKEMAAKIKQVSEVWDLEEYLTQRRKEIDLEYDYRYSVLPEVFGNLIRKGRVREEDLRGLRADKLDYIQAHAK